MSTLPLKNISEFGNIPLTKQPAKGYNEANGGDLMYNLEEMINRIKTLKKVQKLSNDALSSLSGIPKGTLAKILGSETKDPQISNIIKIAQALGVSADFIIFGKEEPKHDDDFFNMFSSLNADGQSKVIEYMRDLINSGNYRSSSIAADAASVVAEGEKIFGAVHTESK